MMTSADPCVSVPDMSLKTTSAAIVQYLEARFAELGSEGNSISVKVDSNAPWWIADRKHPYSKAAEEAVLNECGVSSLAFRFCYLTANFI